MRKSTKVASVFLSVVLLSNTFGVSVYAEEEKPHVTKEMETDQVIVTFKEDVESKKIDLELKNIKTVDTEAVATLKVPKGETVETFIEELEARSDVESVEPDHLIQLTYTPNDPYFNYFQYHHSNIETERAWDRTMGSSDIVVAVLDAGFDINHSDLVNQIVQPTATSYTGFNVHEHGTHVAGIIGSSIDNYAFGAGVAPKASIMPIDVFFDERAYTSDVIEGIYEAVWAGADIISMSLGSYDYSLQEDNAIQYAYQNGVVIVASAGNDAVDLSHYPSSYDNVISVGSTDSSNSLSGFSNYGYDIDIVAPGSSIYSTLPYGGFGRMSGTSMAAPVVAGVAALVMASEPHLTNDEVVDRLLSTTKDLGSYGKDYFYGNGLVDAKGALKIIELPTPEVFGVYDYSTTVSGYIGTDIENGTVTVRNQSGNTIGSQENYVGYDYFDVTIPKQTAGTKLYVAVTDAYGNESEAAEVTVEDSTAPDAPIVGKVTDKSTSVTGSAEANASISIKAGTKELGTTNAASDGKFKAAIAVQKAGTKLSVTAADAAGNLSAAKVVTVLDATAPNAPTVDKVTEHSAVITGTAEAASQISVKAGTSELGSATVDATGKFSVSIAKQKAGTKLTVTAKDAAGNISEAVQVTVLDTTAPAVPSVEKVTDKSTVIKGSAEANSTILVKAGDKELGKATAGVTGLFELTIEKLKAGTVLKVTATDQAGNISPVKEITVVDATAPGAPVVNRITGKTTEVTGTAEALGKVLVSKGAVIVAEGTAAADGRYKLPIAALPVGTKLEVYVTDQAGNMSPKVTVTVVKAEAEKTARISGKTRYDTAIAISQEGWKTADTVVLATGADFPDALAGGPLAYQQNAPILLTRPASLYAATEKEIVRLKAKKVIILGSTTAVSAAVEKKLKDMGLAVERIGGATRFDTAKLIAARLPSEQAILAYGLNFPDVLAISPYAAKNGIPILLTRTDRIPAETKDALKNKKSTIVVGSTGAVNADVFKQLPKAVRYGGKTRYETAKEINLKLPLGNEQAYVATGRNYPDALAGSVLAAKNNASMLLVTEKAVPVATKDILSKYQDYTIFGSTGAVGGEVEALLNKELQRQH